jgi:osmotically inducible lipoprotein OsmB
MAIFWQSEPIAFAFVIHKLEGSMQYKKFSKLAAVMVFAGALAGCSTWDSMTGREKAAVTGAGVGGVVGAAVTGGGVLGTVGGAAIGGVVGDQIGKHND